MVDGPVMSDFERARWERAKGRASEHNPGDALKAFLDDIVKGKCEPRHLIIVYANKNGEDEKDSVGWYQAGDLEHLAQVGLLDTAKYIMNQDYRD
jgi:hypothetical protein